MNSINATDPAWYCIRTKRYKENWVIQQLAASCNEVYLPLLRQRRVVKRRPRWMTEPLFPGYVFACFSVYDKYRTVRYTSGVLDVISTAKEGPTEVDETLIVAIRAASVEGCVEVQPPSFSPGEELEIIAGPFQQLHALFQHELKAGERVAVLLELLSSQVRVELPRDYIQKKADGVIQPPTPAWAAG